MAWSASAPLGSPDDEPRRPRRRDSWRLVTVQPAQVSKTGTSTSRFLQAKLQFDQGSGAASVLASPPVPVHGKQANNLIIRNAAGAPLEEYYKWQFVHALIDGGLYAPEFIGVEVHFPKGSAAALQLDGAIFDDPDWITHYNNYWSHKHSSDLEWLNDHLLAVIEFKRLEKDMERVFTKQLKPAMREKDPAHAYVLGVFYDHERLLLFHRRSGLYLRYDEAKNGKGDASKIGDLSLHLPDPFEFMPSFKELQSRIAPRSLTRKGRSISDLGTVTSIATAQVQTALSDVLRTLDKAGLVSQRGYQVLIETFAVKIFDEKRNEANSKKKLEFYVTHDEANFHNLAEPAIQKFVARMKSLTSEAKANYRKILGGGNVDWSDPNHVRAVVAVAQAFQDYSFVLSQKSDLYQLVFYNFANSFKRDESAQFLTPIPVIDFLVQLVNPRRDERIIDPCCGIGDFLSLSFVHSQELGPTETLDDANIYGVDIDNNMIMLATLNMLLNGDGEAKLFHRPDKGSILSKVAQGTPPELVDLQPATHKDGNWDTWLDQTALLKFDVVLTNPPFGEDRALRPKTKSDRELVECYETWYLAGKSDTLDLGVVFLENAMRVLKPGGRLGIVLSNSTRR
jgi:type I restriction enzyme M protein